MTPAIQVDQVVKRYGDREVLHGIDLDITPGEFVVIVGRSGCGKSTLLRLIAGLESIDDGHLRRDGDTEDGLLDDARVMFQDARLLPWKKVLDNVALGLPKTQRAQAAEVLAQVGLAERAGEWPARLSGGQRQRVALARALVKRPKLLLLDEPLGALDKKLREQTQFELVNLQEKLGVTFIIVTHDQEEAMTLASRIGVMKSGKILQVGSPTDIYEFPNSRYVADFIGSVNLFDGQLVVDEPDHCRIRCERLGIDVFVDHGVSAAPDAAVTVALRPEKIRLVRERPEQRDNVVRGIVTGVAYLGDSTRFLLQLPNGTRLQVTRPNTDRRDERYSYDDEVWAFWEPGSPVVVSR